MIGSPAPQETRNAGRPSSSLRFTGPEQARKRMRLLTAIAMLVVAAVATASVATLSTGSPSAEEPTPRLRALAPDTPELLDPARFVEAHVEEAERALAGARAAIQSARQLGVVDPQLLDEFQSRLDSATARARPSTAVEQGQPSEAPRLPVDGSPRDL